jgi:NAD(P)-dependent dehydrogenase (short-subunit alcohol dehydrogenase family)
MRSADGFAPGRVRGMARSVLVAGGTGALGGAVLEELAGAGWDVTATWVVDRERERVERAMGDRVRLVQADLMDADAVAAAVEGVEDLRAVVNLVGGFDMGGKVHETDPAAFARMLDLNLKPGFLLARAAMPRLAEAGGGAYVGVSSRAALRPFAGAAGYIVGKAGVIAFVEALAAEYRDAGVRANCVVPSTIDTPANRESMPDADHSKWVPPAEIARVIGFLVSDASAPTSGAAVPVYGRA